MRYYSISYNISIVSPKKEGCQGLIHFFFTGASLCRCITFPGHLLTSKEGETAPDGHNY